jgi:hypothetical protein
VKGTTGIKGVSFLGDGTKSMKNQSGFEQNLRYLCTFMKMIRKHSPGFYIICPMASCGPPAAAKKLPCVPGWPTLAGGELPTTVPALRAPERFWE